MQKHIGIFQKHSFIPIALAIRDSDRSKKRLSRWQIGYNNLVRPIQMIVQFNWHCLFVFNKKWKMILAIYFLEMCVLKMFSPTPNLSPDCSVTCWILHFRQLTRNEQWRLDFMWKLSSVSAVGENWINHLGISGRTNHFDKVSKSALWATNMPQQWLFLPLWMVFCPSPKSWSFPLT